jgi:hypothetical protein
LINALPYNSQSTEEFFRNFLGYLIEVLFL